MSEIEARRWLVAKYPHSFIQNLAYENGVLSAYVDGEYVTKQFEKPKKAAKKAKK